MSMPKSLQSLSRLVDLRAMDVNRLTAAMESKRVLRDRYRGNLERLEKLCAGSGASSSSLSPALSLNCAAYKQAVMQLAHEHRQDLALHEADMAVAQRALSAASCKHEVLGQVLEQRRHCLREEQKAREQKRQDELAAQSWLRGRR
jgi:flagellar export protein FliJ